MPKNQRQGRNPTTKVPFRFLTGNGANTTGFHSWYLDLNPGALGTRVAAMQLMFKKWRFSKPLRIKMFAQSVSVIFWANDNSTPSDNTVGQQDVQIACGYYGAPTATTSTPGPTSLDAIVELVHSDIGPTTGPLIVRVPMAELNRAKITPWALTFNTSDTVLFTADTVIGAIWYGFYTMQGNPSGYPINVTVSVSGEVEFDEPVLPAAAMYRQLAYPAKPSDDDDEKSTVVVVKE